MDQPSSDQMLIPDLLGVERGPAARYEYSYPGLPLEQESGWEAGSRRRVGDAKH